MLASSHHTTSFFPVGGPKVSLVRFSTEPSTCDWTSLLDVRLEKFIVRFTIFAGSRDFR